LQEEICEEEALAKNKEPKINYKKLQPKKKMHFQFRKFALKEY